MYIPVLCGQHMNNLITQHLYNSFHQSLFQPPPRSITWHYGRWQLFMISRQNTPGIKLSGVRKKCSRDYHHDNITHLGARSNGIQHAASNDWAASSMITKSKWSFGRCFNGPSLEADTLVDNMTWAFWRICFSAFSSRSLNSLRSVLISVRSLDLSPEFRLPWSFR